MNRFQINKKLLSALVVIILVIIYINATRYFQEKLIHNGPIFSRPDSRIVCNDNANTFHQNNCTSQAPLLCEEKDECNLVAIVLVRIYEYDPAKFTTEELEQWMKYLFFAGVDHIHLYDNFQEDNERLRKWLRTRFSPNYVTYHDWGIHYMSYAEAQKSAYQDAVNRYRSKWQMALDIDEYPFAAGDLECGFLTRAIDKLSTTRWDVTEISVKNIVFGGNPEEHNWLIERYLNREQGAKNDLDKPIYQPGLIKHAQVHHNALQKGSSIDVDPNVLRLNHYWGERLLKKEQLKTVFDESILKLAEHVQTVTNCINFLV